MSDTLHETLSSESPYSVRLKAYLAERFPLVGHGVLILSYYSSNQFLAKVLSYPGQPIRYTGWNILGMLALFLVFFHLRIFDEHKDFEEDSKFYPERLLQRGIVSLNELKLLGLAAISLELILSGLKGLSALLAMLIVIIYSALMLKEFFVAEWLKKRFLIYTATHMLIMPLMALFVYSFTIGRRPWEAPAWFIVYAFVGLFVTLNWEVSRKIRAPEDEKEGLASYSSVFGTFGAANLVLLIRIVDTALVALVGFHLGLSSLFYVFLVLLFIVCLYSFVHFRTSPSSITAKRMEQTAGIYIIAFDLILAAELVRKYGLEFTL